MIEPVLRLEALHKSFGGLTVVRNVTLEVAVGELHAVIGPNGAGKTTLINQISGLIAPDSGRIVFAGRDVTALSVSGRAALGLARSFQITSILPAFSVIENVALAVQARIGSSFRFFGRANAEEALNTPAMAALGEVGLAARADVLAGHLSHGEKRALELAIALAMQPKLLLLDEPMAGAGREESKRLIDGAFPTQGAISHTAGRARYDGGVCACRPHLGVDLRRNPDQRHSGRRACRSAGHRCLSRRRDGVKRCWSSTSCKRPTDRHRCFST